MCDFNEKVLSGLKECGVKLDSNVKIGAAVSGGADSVSLLTSLCQILFPLNIPLYVITVNHNIRPKEETAGDAEFVQQLCNKFIQEGMKVSCSVIELEKGLVQKSAKERKCGIEEAARFLRYEAFNNFIGKNHLDYLCLAHNRNDQLETILMRFLQGGSTEALAGIKNQRDKFIRPLLNIPRNEIEAFLIEQKITWRTDSTNLDDKYLRNNIRLNLITLLNKKFEGWQNAVLSGAKRSGIDGDFIQNSVNAFPMEKSEKAISFLLNDFFYQSPAVQVRLLIKAINLAGENGRIPYNFLTQAITQIRNAFNQNEELKLRFENIQICVKRNQLFVKKYDKSQTDLVFFDIIEESGEYKFPFGRFVFSNGIFINDFELPVKIMAPFIIRNVQHSDLVKACDGTMKKVVDVLSDWHVSSDEKSLIPVIQKMDDKQTIICICGRFLGYKDWIIK